MQQSVYQTRTLYVLWAFLLLPIAVLGAADDPVLTVHRFVPHVSTVTVDAGTPIGLYARERVLASVARSAENRKNPPTVVLSMHGGFSPSAVAYDLDYKDFSWMA